MASQQSNITSISTPTSNPETMTPLRSTTSIGMTTSNANPTVSTLAPVLTDAVQKCVDTAAEAIATHREARLIFMQGLVRRILREAYRESTSPPSAGTPLAQSVFAGIPSIRGGSYPSFVTHPNYLDGQIHHYYPSNPIPQSPATSAPTTTQPARVTASQTSTLTSTTSSTATTTSTSSSNTIPTMTRETHRSHTVFAPIDLVESLTKTNHLLVADMKSLLQSMNNQLSTQSTDLKTRMESLEQGFMELREVVMQRTINNLKPNPELLEVWNHL